jgi:hypothetical protein
MDYNLLTACLEARTSRSDCQKPKTGFSPGNLLYQKKKFLGTNDYIKIILSVVIKP